MKLKITKNLDEIPQNLINLQPNFKTRSQGWNLTPYSIHIIGLDKKPNHFDFELGDSFFEEYPAGMVSGGKLHAAVIVDKHETFIEVHCRMDGYVRLVCDRSLQPFDQHLCIDKRIVFKYGEEEAELSDEIVVIRRDRDSLELGQFLYEFIVLDIPMKRLHPDFRGNEEDEGEGKMVYTSNPDDTAEEDVIDPRWEQLKKLK